MRSRCTFSLGNIDIGEEPPSWPGKGGGRGRSFRTRTRFDTPRESARDPADRRRLRRAPPPPCLFACSLGICTCGLKQAGASSWRFPLGAGAGFLGHPGASWGFLGSGSKPEGARKQAKSRPEAAQGPSGGIQGQAEADIGSGCENRCFYA